MKGRKRKEQMQRKRTMRAQAMKGGGRSKYAQKVSRGQMYGIQREASRGRSE